MTMTMTPTETNTKTKTRENFQEESVGNPFIDSQDPEYMLFCREITFFAIYSFLLVIFSAIHSNSNRFATDIESLEHFGYQ